MGIVCNAWLLRGGRYLVDEAMNKKKVELDIDEWTVLPRPDDLPWQMNGCDCGVFTCMFADFVMEDEVRGCVAWCGSGLALTR